MKTPASLMGSGALDLQTVLCSHRSGGECLEIFVKRWWHHLATSPSQMVVLGSERKGRDGRVYGPLDSELRELSSSRMQ